jgi:hypothetical protein
MQQEVHAQNTASTPQLHRSDNGNSTDGETIEHASASFQTQSKDYESMKITFTPLPARSSDTEAARQDSPSLKTAAQTTKRLPTLLPLEPKKSQPDGQSVKRPLSTRKRERNKLAAERYRNRIKAVNVSLDSQLETTKAENSRLQLRVRELEGQIQRLRTQLAVLTSHHSVD